MGRSASDVTLKLSNDDLFGIFINAESFAQLNDQDSGHDFSQGGDLLSTFAILGKDDFIRMMIVVCAIDDV